MPLDRLQMLFREPYVIETHGFSPITLIQPTIGDIVAFGEKRFYSTLNVFITNTTVYRLPLWEAGIDWNEFSNFQLFLILYQNIDREVASLLFDNLDFSKLKLYSQETETGAKEVLYDEENNIIIDEKVYNCFSEYFQNIFGMKPEEKKTSDALMKQWFIDKDKRQLEIDATKKEEKKESSLYTLISACINHPGFKYKLQELKDVGVCEFYDSVKRLQVYESTTALMRGMYSGFMDSSKIKPDDYNFMKDI